MRTQLFVVAKRSTFITTAVAIAALLVSYSIPAHAAIVPTINLATAADFTVLAAEEITNTGFSTMDSSIGVSPGTSITGFPPGIVNAPGTQHIANGNSGQAQIDLTAAYVDAEDREVTATVAADLGNQVLNGGVYATSGKGALLLNGPLTLDGEGNEDSVFIIQTDSSLTTGSGSSVILLNGAKQCNVFWQVGSSATLGTGSTMVGNIMALASISLNDSVTVQGRALALTGSVTLINDTFTQPSCIASTATTTTTSTTTTPATTTTVAGDTTSGASSTDGRTSSGGDSRTSGRASGSASSVGIERAPLTGATPLINNEVPWVPIMVSCFLVAAVTYKRRSLSLR